MTKMFTRIFTVVLVAFIVVSVVTLGGCGDDVVSGSGEVHHASESTSETEAVEENLIGMEKMGSAGNFTYYRDVSTDVMYLWRFERGYNAGYGGLTIMVNPKTGLPLTYSDWIEFKDGEYFGTDESEKGGS